MRTQVAGRSIGMALLALTATATPTYGQGRSPVQYTRDGAATLVQKDTGDGQWTITYELQTGHVTGNVRREDGASTFLDCDRLESTEGLARFDCHVAAGCMETPCTSQPWVPLREVELAESFFLPEEEIVVDSGCCDLGGPCVDTGPSPNACVSTGGTFFAGATCEFVGVPEEPCPDELPEELCFIGACR